MLTVCPLAAKHVLVHTVPKMAIDAPHYAGHALSWTGSERSSFGPCRTSLADGGTGVEGTSSADAHSSGSLPRTHDRHQRNALQHLA